MLKIVFQSAVSMLILMPSLGHSETKAIPVFSTISTQMQPQTVLIMIWDDVGEPTVVLGEIIKTGSIKQNISEGLKVGGYVDVDERATKIWFRSLALAADGASVLGPIEELALGDNSTAASDEVATKELIQSRIRNIDDLQQDLSYAQQKLKRLQSDADAIASVGKIIDAEDNLAIVNSDLQRFESVKASLSQDLSLIKERGDARNYQLREAELTSQVNALAAVTRTFESGTSSRQAESYRSFEEKMSLIEENKGEQIDRLREDLARIQRRKAAILTR